MKDEASAFAAVLVHARLCLRCAANRSEVSEERLVAVIHGIQRTRTVTERMGSCDSCGRTTQVYRID